MNITELDSYNLDDAVKFNDHLNPRLWNDREHLRPEVRERLLEIAQDFREFLGVTDLAIKDITVSGSNAAYTYTPNSDIDLHLVVDMPDNPVYRELFDAKKFQYNEQHDIKIGGADVELYVQDADKPHISQGVYSLLNNDWLQVPRRVRSVVDDTSTRNKFEKVGKQIESAIRSGNLKRMTRLAEKIKKMRQTGLENHGEFGPENLAFKMLRKQGLIKQLYDARNSAKDREFSLKEKAVAPQLTYGFKTPTVVEAAPVEPEDTTPSDEEILQDFIEFCVKELKIKSMPTIKLRRDPQWSVRHSTFGRYINDKHLLEVAWGQRHIMDVLRTVAHELTHKHQHERDGARMGATAGETGSPWENEANARAGIIMRDYARLHPEYFAVGQAADLHEEEVDESLKGSAVAALSACIIGGGSLSGCATQQGMRPMDAARIIYNAKQYNSTVVRADVAQELNNFIRAQRGETNAQNQSRLYQLQRPQNESASGYIPTKKQAKDPRWSMALTQDIRPGQLGKEANKLNLKTNKQGIPQVANPNGLFEKLALELEQFKKTQVAESVQQLDEVNMSPSVLMKWATSPEAQGIRAGFEAELIFRDTTNNGDSDYEMEPDYDADERCRSISQIIEFFNDGEYGGLSQRQERSLQDGLDEQYMEWYDEQMQKDFRDEAEDLIRKVLVDEGDWDLDDEIQKQLALLDLTDDEMNDIINAGERAPKFNSSKEQVLYAEANPLYDKYLDAQKEAEDLLDALVEDEVRTQGANWDAALDDFRDNYQIDDDSGFFDDAGLRYMSDVASEYSLDWPYMTGGGGNDGGRDWDSIGDSLHNVVGMPVKVSSNYHSTTRKEGLWIVEPDSSLDPDDREDMGLEIVSPPMPLLMALEKLQAVTDWANDSSEGNAYTNSTTGLHMGVSVPYKGGDVDYLKLILFLGDEYVLQQFGREANTYTKSAMKGFRENLKSGRSDPASAMKLMQHGLLELAQREIQKGVGQGKYTSAHIQNGYIEFRSAGGDWLAEESADPAKLQNTMLRYARAMQIAASPASDRREYAKKLYKLVAPEGDSQLALFSQYASGELTAEQLKKRWAEKTIGNEKKMNQFFKLYQKVNGVWTAVPGAEYRGMQEDEVKNRVWMKYGREALDTGEYQLVNMSDNQEWEVYDVKTGATLEIVQAANKGAAADQVYDKYVDQGIGFNVRPYVDPKTLTPRAKLAKRIVDPKQQKPKQATNERGVPYWEVFEKETGHVVHTFLSDTAADAKVDGKNWLKSIGAEQPDLFDTRPKTTDSATVMTKAADANQAVDNAQDSARLQATLTGSIPEVPMDVAQNFGNQFSGQWQVVDGLGREVYRFRGAGNNQGDANRIAALWARENNFDGNLEVLPVMIESIDPVSGSGARLPAMPPKLKSQPPVKPVDPAVNINIKKSQTDPYAQTYKKPVEEGYGQYTRINDPGIFPDGFLYLSNHAKHDRLPQRGIDMDRVIDLCRQAGNQYPQKLRNLGDIQFVIKAPDDFGVGLVKYQTPDGHYRYLIKTAHNRLRYGPEEPVFRVGAVAENFADGKGPGRPGDSQRHGIPKGATMAQLEKASHASGRKGQLARWQINMRRGHKE